MKRGWDFYYGYRGKGIEVMEEDAAEILDTVKGQSTGPKPYFDTVISNLRLPDEAKKIMKEKNVQSFDDLKKNGLLKKIIEEGKINDKTSDKLKAFNRFDKISNYDFDLSNSLINNGIFSAYKLSKIPRNDFIENYRKIAKKDELTIAHKRAVETISINFGVATWAYLISRNNDIDKILPGYYNNKEIAEKILRGHR